MAYDRDRFSHRLAYRAFKDQQRTKAAIAYVRRGLAADRARKLPDLSRVTPDVRAGFLEKK